MAHRVRSIHGRDATGVLTPCVLDVRRLEEGIGLTVGHRPSQASVLPDDPILLLVPMNMAGPGLKEDVIVELVQLGP